MVIVAHEPAFKNKAKKIKNSTLKEKVKKQIAKIVSSPEIGKPMKYSRKDTREIYIKPYRLSYLYLKKENTIVLLDLYHKDEQ